MTTYKWTTEKGAKVEIEVSKNTRTEDRGYGITKEYTETTVDSATVNGNKVTVTGLNGQNMIGIKINGNRAGINIPSEIKEAIWGEENKVAKAKLEKQMKQEAEYQAHCDKMKKAMDA